ncbi:MAG: DUF169 domain-containing protein [Actinobacteria bacterium]|nr:DUF169 domain-containing protein [Actinomycetota bacterium]
MENWVEVGKKLEEHLRPATFPLGIRFLAEGEAAPERARRPIDESGCPIAICQAFSISRRRGLTLYFDREQSSCPLASAALGWGQGGEEALMASFLQVMNYARDEETARKKSGGMAKLEAGRYPALVIFPLTRARVEPHLAMVYGTPAQVMRLVQATSRWTGERVQAAFGGIGGSCNEGLIGTFLADMPRAALPGNGDRVFAATQDDEMIFAFPASWAERVLEGLEATASRGVRYPVPTFMDYHLPFVDLVAKFGQGAGD